MIQLDESAQNELLRIARNTLEHYLQTGKVPEVNPAREELHQPAGVFVSLHNGEDLRGCIGLIRPEGPLFSAVQHCAVSAASEDFRFHQVTAAELPEVTIEISILTPLERAEDLEEITVGRHGLYVVRGQRRGLLLPQVATSLGWDRETFLGETCGKAGLPEDAWRDPATAVYLFEAQVFSEKAPA